MQLHAISRANRLAPLALNLPRFCKAVGPELGPLRSEYSSLFPNTNVHFYSECDRFCRFILRKVDEGFGLDPVQKPPSITNSHRSRSPSRPRIRCSSDSGSPTVSMNAMALG